MSIRRALSARRPVAGILALGLLVLARDEPLGGLGSLAATHAAGWTVGAGGLLLTAAGLVLLRVSARERRPARATAGTPA